MKKGLLKEFLDKKVIEFENINFIKNDPIQIPHRFVKKKDIEISAFLTAMLSWGRRETIIKNSLHLMNIMDNSPYDYILNHSEIDLKKIINFKHRTFNESDLKVFIKALKNIYINHSGLEKCFETNEQKVYNVITNFKLKFFEKYQVSRTHKHISEPRNGSACKRIMMFLRWMVRSKNKGVDFEIWKSLKPSQLYCPLDIHSARVSRKLGLIKRKNNDWKTLIELDENLTKFCPYDPAKYDFALFGIGIN